MTGLTVGRQRRRNFALHVWEGAIYFAGVEFASATSIMPVLLERLGASRAIIGLAASFTYVGTAAQVLAVPAMESMPRRKQVLVRLGLFMRLPYAAMALAVLLLAPSAPTACIVAVLLLTLVTSLAGGLTNPAWLDLVRGTIPRARLSSLFGLRHALGGLLIAGTGATATLVLTTLKHPVSFAVLLGLACLVTMASWGLFTNVLDSPPRRPRRALPGFRAHMLQLVADVRGDTVFLRLLLARCLYLVGRAGETFYTVCALERFQSRDSAAGTFMLTMALARCGSALLFSRLTDRVGRRATAVLSSVLGAAAGILAIAAPSEHAFLGVFVLAGICFSTGQIAGTSLIMQLAPREGSVGFFSMLLMGQIPVMIAAQIGGGALVDHVGFSALFSTTAVAGLLGAIAYATLPGRGGAERAATGRA